MPHVDDLGHIGREQRIRGDNMRLINDQSAGRGLQQQVKIGKRYEDSQSTGSCIWLRPLLVGKYCANPNS